MPIDLVQMQYCQCKKTEMALPDLDVGQSVGEKEVLEIESGYGLEQDESEITAYIPTLIQRVEQDGSDEMRTSREEDVLDLADENMSLSSPVKRGREEEDRCDVNRRSRGDEVKGLQVDIKDLCEKAMIKIVEKSEKVAERTLLISENMVRAMTENTCVLANWSIP